MPLTSRGSPGSRASWAPAWQQPLEQLVVGEVREPSLINLNELDEFDPASFYLPGSSAGSLDSPFAWLTDAFADVDGTRLLLHSQVLAARSAVLRAALLEQAESSRADSPQGPTDLTSMFAGHGVVEVACFLRLLYSPDQATPATLAKLHASDQELLRMLVRLAHRLDVPGLLGKCERYLQEAAVSMGANDLLPWLELAEECHLETLHDACVQQLARRLAASGPYWHEQVSPQQLAARISASSLASLVCATASAAYAGELQPPALFDVRSGLRGQVGGFSWTILNFSKLTGRVVSPWVKVGGLLWRLKVWPRGDDASGGSHMSAYVEVDLLHMQRAGLAACQPSYELAVINQAPGAEHYVVDCGQDVFAAATANWGKTQLMAHSLLHRTDLGYLKGDRLVMRLDMCVKLPPNASQAAKAAFEALQQAALLFSEQQGFGATIQAGLCSKAAARLMAASSGDQSLPPVTPDESRALSRRSAAAAHGVLQPLAAFRPHLLCVDLAALDPERPENYYLPAADLVKLSDAFAVVDGARLPLHSQLLAAQSAVLREALLGHREGASGCGGNSAQVAELTSAFSGHSLAEVACFLRLVYSPDLAVPASLEALYGAGGGLLRALVRLAHRLDAAGLLEKCERYLQGVVVGAEVADLLPWLELAEACHLATLQDTCLQQLAHRLAAAGPFWQEQVSREQLLAHCSSETMAALACAIAGTVPAGGLQPAVLFDVRPGLDGGFTWVLQRFSQHSSRVCSPWVKVGGLEWRLKFWPRGDDAAGGDHLSGYLEVNWAQMQCVGLPAVLARYDFTVFDQASDGTHITVDCGQDVFSGATRNWGKTRLVRHSELWRGDRQYLKDDRLVVRINIQPLLPNGANAAAAAAFEALQQES